MPEIVSSYLKKCIKWSPGLVRCELPSYGVKDLRNPRAIIYLTLYDNFLPKRQKPKFNFVWKYCHYVRNIIIKYSHFATKKLFLFCK